MLHSVKSILQSLINLIIAIRFVDNQLISSLLSFFFFLNYFIIENYSKHFTNKEIVFQSPPDVYFNQSFSISVYNGPKNIVSYFYGDQNSLFCKLLIFHINIIEL